MRRAMRASPDMDSSSQDHGVSRPEARPSLLSPSAAPASAPGVRLLDAIHPQAHAAAVTAGKPRAMTIWLWGLTGMALLGGASFWLASAGSSGESSAPRLARATPAPPPASQPASAQAQAIADASAASQPSATVTPAQIVAMTAPQPAPPRPDEGMPTNTATAARALVEDSLAERAPAPETQANPTAHRPAVKTSPTRKPAKTANGKRSAESGSGVAKAKSKAARQRSEPDPDADVVAAIMAGMDRQAAAAAKSAQAASQPGARRP